MNKFFIFQDIKCSGVNNLTAIFKLASEKLENVNDTLKLNKHFDLVTVGHETDHLLVLNELSFADITFNRFMGLNIQLIHNNAFGRAKETINIFENLFFINHQPPDYDIWNVFRKLTNIEKINIQLNVTKIPSRVFKRQFKLSKISIQTPNQVTIKSKAFYHVDHLKYLKFESAIKKIETEAFAFEKESNQEIRIRFDHCNFSDNSFEVNSFDGIQRPVQIEFVKSNISFISESSFQSVLNDTNNYIKFQDSFTNCFDCKNYWLIKDGKDEQVSGAKCMHNNELMLFSHEIKSHLGFRCNLSKSIQFNPCEYCSRHVSFKLNYNQSFSFYLSQNMLVCYSNMTNPNQVFKSISSQLNQSQKHFDCIKIRQSNATQYLVLDNNSFDDISFDNFVGENIKFIHHNAFGGASKAIKKFILRNGYVNHQPPEYDVWKLFNEFVNVERINVHLNINEIPSNAFNQTNLQTIIIHTANKITLKKHTFYSLDHLNELHFECGFNKIESEAFAMKKSSEKLNMTFYEFDGDLFQPDSFKGLHRPIRIQIHSDVTYIPESSFKSILDNQNSIEVSLYIDCYQCKNYWLVRDERKKQVSGANCQLDKSINLFHHEIEYFFKEYCINHTFYNQSILKSEKSVFNKSSSPVSSFNYLLLLIVFIFIINHK